MVNNVAPIRESLIDIPDSLAQEIVSSIHAVGDIMKASLNRTRYVSHIHDSGEFWDILNTKVCKSLNATDCMSHMKKSGFWDLLLVDYKPANLIFTFMREERFSAVQRDVKRTGKMCYVNTLIQHFNKDLLADVSQTTIFPIHTYDEAELAKRVQRLISDFQENDNAVEHYMMVLFDCDRFYELRKVSAVIVDTNLDIVEEVDWSHFIPVKETVIVEKITDIASPSNNPSRGIRLKSKAMEQKLKQQNLDFKSDGDSEKQ